MAGIEEEYAGQIAGTISCFDRVLITGTLPDICHAKAMKNQLYIRGIRIFDYTKLVEPLRDGIRAAAEKTAEDAGLEIEFIRKAKNFRKEARVKEIIEKRGDHPGLVHVFSAMEPCTAFYPWFNRETNKPELRTDTKKCLHYYFYFIDETFGLCFLRVPTWAPFHLQFYFNGHNWLATRLRNKGIEFEMNDNAFVNISDFEAAQRVADKFPVRALHKMLDRCAFMFCPVFEVFPSSPHWSMKQVEYATDIVFKNQTALKAFYEPLLRVVVLAVQADNVAMFLGRKGVHGNYKDEVGNDFSTRVQGWRIKHHMGPAAIKMYDKHGLVLRIETTVNDVTFFKHYRTVEQRDGTRTKKFASVKKTIYSLGVMRELMLAANRRYLEFISELDRPSDGGPRKLEKISKPVRSNSRSYRGFNLFHGDDLDLFVAISRGEHHISGMRNRDLQRQLGKTGSQVSRMLKRLRLHGLIKKVGRTYKYYLTSLGRTVLSCALRLRQNTVIPALAATG